VRAERLVVERHAARPERLPDALAEARELLRAFTRSQPDDARLSALREAADTVQSDVERRNAGGRDAEGVGRRRKTILGNVADEGEREMEERCRDTPKRGEVSGNECRRALGYICGELDRDEEADIGRLDACRDTCRLDLVRDKECKEGDRKDHGEHGQHSRSHCLIQFEVLPGRLDQLAHEGSRSKQRAGCSVPNGPVTTRPGVGTGVC